MDSFKPCRAGPLDSSTTATCAKVAATQASLEVALSTFRAAFSGNASADLPKLAVARQRFALASASVVSEPEKVGGSRNATCRWDGRDLLSV
jgi:hypothetical protein